MARPRKYHTPEEARAAKNAQNKAWREKNRDTQRARKKSWRDRNPDKVAAQNLRSRYGLSAEVYQAMLVGQSGRCAICTSVMMGDREPCIDHCHESGRVRGLLCRSCNLGLGRFRDDPMILSAAIIYLQENQPPAG